MHVLAETNVDLYVLPSLPPHPLPPRPRGLCSFLLPYATAHSARSRRRRYVLHRSAFDGVKRVFPELLEGVNRFEV